MAMFGSDWKESEKHAENSPYASQSPEIDTTKLVKDIQAEVEWLSTTEGDEVECISIESLEGILSRHLDKK